MSRTFLELKERESVCRKVLGLILTPDRDWGTLWCHPEEEAFFKSGDTSVLFETPSFTTYKEFGLIVEAMMEKGFEVDAMFDSSDREWEVCFGKEMGREPTWTTHHPNLATATAQAALACVEEK